MRIRPDGQVVVDVLPWDLYDRLLLNGYRVEVWMQPGVSVSEVRSRSGRCLREHEPARVALVLGAGNISSIAPLDVLYKLYADGDVVVVKMNPVNALLRPVLERVFAPFVRHGFVRFVSGGAEVGGYLAHHPKVGAVHMTGSAAVHDLVVFGDGLDGVRRKADGRPMLDKPITSELGGVSPTIVVGGRWAEADLRYQAEHVAVQKLHNCGFNCVASQVLVLPAGWEQAGRFLVTCGRRSGARRPVPLTIPELLSAKPKPSSGIRTPSCSVARYRGRCSRTSTHAIHRSRPSPASCSRLCSESRACRAALSATSSTQPLRSATSGSPARYPPT
jgi:aldehyde dehydrogenase family protein